MYYWKKEPKEEVEEVKTRFCQETNFLSPPWENEFEQSLTDGAGQREPLMKKVLQKAHKNLTAQEATKCCVSGTPPSSGDVLLPPGRRSLSTIMNL